MKDDEITDNIMDLGKLQPKQEPRELLYVGVGIAIEKAKATPEDIIIVLEFIKHDILNQMFEHRKNMKH